MIRSDMILASVGFIYGAIQPALAQATDLVTPLDNWAQVGVCGLFGVILIVLIYKNADAQKEVAASNERGCKAMGESCERGMKAMADQVSEMRNDIQENTQSQFKLLSEVVKTK